MPLPILAVVALGAVGGVAARGAIGKVRTWLNNGETICVDCPKCGHGGPHEFVFIDRGWATSAAAGVLTGAIGGTLVAVMAKRVFKCKGCEAPMYKSGEGPGWNADDAIRAFFRHPSLNKAHEELETKVAELQKIIANNQEVAKKKANEIAALERDLQKVNLENANLEGEKEKLEELLRQLLKRTKDLISQAKREADAA